MIERQPIFLLKLNQRPWPYIRWVDCIPLTLLHQHNPSKEGWTLKGIDHHKSKFLLTHREREVFELLVQDKTTRDIAGQLFISEKTVRNHISNVMQKLNVKGRSQAVVELIKLGELKI